MPEDTPLVERDAAFRGEIGCDARALCHAVMKSNHPRHFLFETVHPFREGVAQPLDDLKQRKVDITKPAAKEISTPAARYHLLEMAEIFRPPPLPELRAAAPSLRALLLVIERAC